MEDIENFVKFGDPNFPLFQKHGGIAVFVNSVYAQYIIDMRFTKCSISFSISVFPNIFFMGVYVYPSSSNNYRETDFAIVINEANYWMTKGFHPYIGGDFNSRIGDLNVISKKSLNWRYTDNCDSGINDNKIFFTDMCDILNILPLNHCIYLKKLFDGDFTYFKANKKSQIDFVLTDNVGRRNVDQFVIVHSGWHFSDHLPIDTDVRCKFEICALSLLIRSRSTMESTGICNTYNRSNNFKLYNRKKYDFNAAKELLSERSDEITNICQISLSSDFIVNRLHKEMGNMIDNTLLRDHRPAINNVKQASMKECDQEFEKYMKELRRIPQDVLKVEECYSNYQLKRNTLNQNLLTMNNNKYKSIIESNDSKKLWASIDWSGNLKKKSPSNHPQIEELSEHFRLLYEPLEDDGDLNTLRSEVYIPATDDEINAAEVNHAYKQMKKGGYDFPLSCIGILISVLGSVLLLLMNIILLGAYPANLCISLMSALPKSGNLRLSDNYRGIQMQRLLANLYDRIICNRLLLWANVSDEQTAQKGKSTIDQIFMLRIIISLIRNAKMPLYIGFFDLSKAFDRVSRYLMLKQLIKLGIGSVMLAALISMYSVTRCVLRGFGKISEIFETFTGIKQGASSSMILFIVFLDDIIDDLKEKCAIEPVILDLHCLLHADDTLLISTNRELFTQKCNMLNDKINEKKMKLNMKKSGYMIINGGNIDIKCDIKMKSGWLEYKKSQKYLGVIFTDTGVLKNDINNFLDKKNKDVNVKLASFITNNELAPVMIKLKVVNACINSALTYGCETWGSTPLNQIEFLQRKALRMILDVDKTTSNEIVYMESGYKKLKPSIYKRQLTFFRKFKKQCEENPDSSISKVFNLAVESNVQYIRHYKRLNRDFNTPDLCYNHYMEEDEEKMKLKIRMKHDIDSEGILGTYLRVNPELQFPKLYQSISCNEFDRKMITKYRTGCHGLRIQKGRLSNTPRENRLCSCEIEIQTVHHVIFNCPLTENIRIFHEIEENNIEEFFENEDYTRTANILKAIDKILT